MSKTRCPSKLVFQTLGICSPYIAVVFGVFILNRGFLAVLFYHVVLLVCIVSINKANSVRILFKGFHPVMTPLIALGGSLAGIVILLFWSVAKRDSIELSRTLTVLNLHENMFLFFSLYACFINPFLEESFWRGCFESKTVRPGAIDGLFAGYHALAIFPVIKLPFTLMVFIAMVFVGWFFRMLYCQTKGLLIPLCTHIIADIAILLALWLIMR